MRESHQLKVVLVDVAICSLMPVVVAYHDPLATLPTEFAADPKKNGRTSDDGAEHGRRSQGSGRHPEASILRSQVKDAVAGFLFAARPASGCHAGGEGGEGGERR